MHSHDDLQIISLPPSRVFQHVRADRELKKVVVAVNDRGLELQVSVMRHGIIQALFGRYREHRDDLAAFPVPVVIFLGIHVITFHRNVTKSQIHVDGRRARDFHALFRDLVIREPEQDAEPVQDYVAVLREESALVVVLDPLHLDPASRQLLGDHAEIPVPLPEHDAIGDGGYHVVVVYPLGNIFKIPVNTRVLNSHPGINLAPNEPVEVNLALPAPEKQG